MNNKMITTAFLVFSLATLHCGGVEDRPTELHFAVTFKDAQGLRPGQFLVYKGVRIGEVTAVDLEGSAVKVGLAVAPTHRLQVYKEATFTIEKLSLLNPTGEHQVVMSDAGKVRTPLEESSVVTGSEGWLNGVTESLKGAANSAVRGAADAIGGSEPTPQQAPSSTSTH